MPERDVIVVTGASRGIGRVVASLLAARGAHVVVTSRSMVDATTTADEIIRSGGFATPIAVDMADFSSVRRAAADIRSEFQRVAALVNNAGMQPASSPRPITADGHDPAMQINFLSVCLLNSLILPVFDGADIINVGSVVHRMGRFVSGEFGVPTRRYSGRVAYNTSKWCLAAYTAGWPDRVPAGQATAVCVHPGSVRTGLTSGTTDFVARTGTKMLWPFFITPAQSGPFVADLVGGDYRNGSYHSKGKPGRPERSTTDSDTQQQVWEWAAERIGAPGPPVVLASNVGP